MGAIVAGHVGPEITVFWKASLMHRAILITKLDSESMLELDDR
jgi:hypothetical protein